MPNIVRTVPPLGLIWALGVTLVTIRGMVTVAVVFTGIMPICTTAIGCHTPATAVTVQVIYDGEEKVIAQGWFAREIFLNEV